MPEDFLAHLDPTSNLSQLNERLTHQCREFTVSVAEKQGQLVAFSIAGKPRFTTDPAATELWALNVLPGYWRMGIGSGLIERAINYSVLAGFENIELWCIDGNDPAQQAYEKLGFMKSGRARASSQLTGNELHELHYFRRLK